MRGESQSEWEVMARLFVYYGVVVLCLVIQHVEIERPHRMAGLFFVDCFIARSGARDSLPQRDCPGCRIIPLP